MHVIFQNSTNMLRKSIYYIPKDFYIDFLNNVLFLRSFSVFFCCSQLYFDFFQMWKHCSFSRMFLMTEWVFFLDFSLKGPWSRMFLHFFVPTDCNINSLKSCLASGRNILINCINVSQYESVWTVFCIHATLMSVACVCVSESVYC